MSSGDEADNLFRLQTRIDNHRRNAGTLRVSDRTNESTIVEWREYNAINALRCESFDDLNLLLAIVLTQRAFPDHLDQSPLGREFTCGLVAAGVNALPEFVCCAFR